MKLTMSTLRAAHPLFFERKTIQLFGDVHYKVLTAKSGAKYLVRLTAQWSDMFGGKKRYGWRVNPLGPAPEYKILPLVDDHFAELEDVKDWLRSQ